MQYFGMFITLYGGLAVSDCTSSDQPSLAFIASLSPGFVYLLPSPQQDRVPHSYRLSHHPRLFSRHSRASGNPMRRDVRFSSQSDLLDNVLASPVGKISAKG